MHKKSQITYFVLIGVIIFIAAGFIFYINNQKTKETEIGKISNALSDTTPLKLFIGNCLENTAKHGLIYTGGRGGYYQLRKPYFKNENFDVPFYLYEYIDYSPSLEDIEKEISGYINDNLPICINNFEEFKKLGFGIIQGIINSSTQIEKNSISFDVNLPLAITKDKFIQKIENFKIIITDNNLKRVHNVSKEIINLQIKNPNKLCLSCIYDLGAENNFYINVVNYGNNSLVFTINDYNIAKDNIADAPYNFTFAIKYEGMSCNKLSSIEDPDLLQECIEIRTKI